jgi:hypothetical protein
MGFVGDFVGDVLGTNDAADAQVDASNKQIAIQQQMYDQGVSMMNPFLQDGYGALPGLQQAMQPINREQALSDYYGSGEYAMMEEQAKRAALTAGEAGGVGGSTISNNLMRIAPSMGMQHLGMLEAQQADQFNRNMGLVNMGQNAAAMTGNAGQNFASQASQAYGQQGQALANKAMAPIQTIASLGSMAAGFF